MLGADSAGWVAPQYVSTLFQEMPARISEQFALLSPSIQVKAKDLLTNVFLGFQGNSTLNDLALMSTADQLLTITGTDFVDAILSTHFAQSVTDYGRGGQVNDESNTGSWYDFVRILQDRRNAFIPLSYEAPPVPSTVVLTQGGIAPKLELITPASSTSQQLVQPFICTQDVMLCADGSFVARTEPNCNFPLCPTIQQQPITGLTIALPNPQGTGTQPTTLPGNLISTDIPQVHLIPGPDKVVEPGKSDNSTLILIGIIGLFLAMKAA